MSAYAIGKCPMSLIRGDEFDRTMNKASNLLEKTPSVPDLSTRLSQANSVWSIYSSSNYNSYWPYSYFYDPNSGGYWFDRFQNHSPLHRRDLFSRWLYNADYMANDHFWKYPYAEWTRYRGYLYDYANPSYYAQEYYYLAHT